MLELYQFEGCPSCARVRETLDELGLDYAVRTVPRDRGLRQRVEKVSGQRGVPVLVDPETKQVIVDSEAIVNWLRKHHAGRALSE